jgi:putative FmdB family regulatory protein
VPIYEYVCPEGHRFERVLKVADCGVPQACECGLGSQKVLSPPMVFVSQEIRYESPIDGKVITTKQQRQDDLARHGCIPYDPEMKKDAARRQVESEKKLEAAMDATIEKTIHEMPSRKREKLTAELQGGVTADYVRLGV